MGRLDPIYFTLPEAELILTSALIALGATRQAGSHIKACVAFGFTETDIQAIVNVADKMVAWQGPESSDDKLPINVENLARHARKNTRGTEASGGG